MKVDLQVAGGFAPAAMAQHFTVDSDQLSDDQRQQLLSLAEEALREPPVPNNPNLRDARSYEVRIVQTDQTRTLLAADGAMPSALGRLIKFVKSAGANS